MRLAGLTLLFGIILIGRGTGHDYGQWYGVLEVVLGAASVGYAHSKTWYRRIVVFVHNHECDSPTRVVD